MANCTKFSQLASGPQLRVDTVALSPRARQQAWCTITLPATTQNTTTRSNAIPCPFPNGARVRQIRFVDGTAPVMSSGTCTLSVEKLGADGATVTALDSPVSRLGRTNLVSYAGAPLASPVTVAVTETIRVACVTSNHTVGTPAANGTASVLFEAIDDTVIDD